VRHTYTCPVRWADMDALGHVNNVVYSDYLQEARADMLRLHARIPATGGLVEGTLVVSQHLQYAAPLVYDAAPVQVEVWVAELRAASFTLAYEVFRPTGGSGTGDEAGDEAGRTVYLRAHTVMAPYLFAEERPRRLTAAERQGLSVYLEETELTRGDFSEPRHGGVDDIGHAPVTVRFSDVDMYGHANNVIYLEYFQESRITLLARHAARMGSSSTVALPAIVVAQQEVEHRRPMTMRETPYDSWTWVSRLGRTSMILEAEIRSGPGEDAELMARGRFVMVFVDSATGRPAPPPDALAESLRATL
jgi:acyl-CoA thioester hydrolase